jgi:hypothetical protein
MSVGAVRALGGGGRRAFAPSCLFGTTAAAAGGFDGTFGGGAGFTSTGLATGGGGSTLAICSTNFTSTSRSVTICRVPRPTAAISTAKPMYRTDDARSAPSQCRRSGSPSP